MRSDYTGGRIVLPDCCFLFPINPEGKIAREWVHVNPRDAATEVLAAIPQPA